MRLGTFESLFFFFEMACIFLAFLEDPFSCHAGLLGVCIFLAFFPSPASFWSLDLIPAPYLLKKERMVLGILNLAESFVLHLLLLDDLLRCLLEKINTVLHLLLSINQQSFHLHEGDDTLISLWYSCTLLSLLDSRFDALVWRVIGLNSKAS